MRKGRLHQTLRGVLLSLAVALMPMQAANACTRAIYIGEDMVITARTMDWANDVESDLWAFPRGMQRNGAAGPNSIHWNSKYGSVVTAGFNVATTDGMNEKGLVAGLLYLEESEYPEAGTKELLCMSLWAQYFLDNYATVKEAMEEMDPEPPFDVITTTVPGPGERPGKLHLAISDPTGDSAIFEYVEGELKPHHNRDYRVMTNSPTYKQQLAINAYWESIDGDAMLPGTARAADRFVRASYYMDRVPKVSDKHEAVAIAFSVIRNVSTPRRLTPEGEELTSTYWITVSDHKNKVYYFESTRGPNVIWVDLNDIDFAAEKPTKLKLTDGAILSLVGNVTKEFKQPTEPFSFEECPVKCPVE